MNVWQPLYGKQHKHVPEPQSMLFLATSNGGQGPSVGLTRMSRGRRNDPGLNQSASSFNRNVMGYTGQKDRSPSPGRSVVGHGWYLESCEVKKDDKASLYSKIGGEIGVERITKTCVQASKNNPRLARLLDMTDIPAAKQLCTYLLGQHIHEFMLRLPAVKDKLIRMRDELGVTEEDFDDIEEMFKGAIHIYCTNNEMRRQWDTVSMCFRRDIEKGEAGKVVDKKKVSWDVKLPYVKHEPFKDVQQGRFGRIVSCICGASKILMSDPDLYTAIARVFIAENVVLDSCDLETNADGDIDGLRLKFHTVPELYDDRKVARGIDLAYSSIFIKKLSMLLDPTLPDLLAQEEEEQHLEAQRRKNDAAREKELKERSPRSARRRKSLAERKAERSPGGTLRYVDNGQVVGPDSPASPADGQEKKKWDPNDPDSVMNGAVDISGLDLGDSKTIVEAQQRRIVQLESSIKTMHNSYHSELCGVLRKLEVAANRIEMLETMKDRYPAEVEEAQKLVSRMIREEITATGVDTDRRPDSAKTTSTTSMQMIEMLPTPRKLDDMLSSPRLTEKVQETFGENTLKNTLKGEFTLPQLDEDAQAPVEPQGSARPIQHFTEMRLQPGESIDLKLREWIDASQRLLDLNA